MTKGPRCGALLLILALSGCQSDIDAYAKVTSQAITELDSKIRTYAADVGRIDAARQQVQLRNQQNIDAESALIQQQLTIWNVMKDSERARLVDALRGASVQAVATQDAGAPPAVPLKTIQSPPGLTASAKALDGLAQGTSVADEFIFLVKYAEALQQDVENDKNAKAAESSGTHVAATGGN